MHTLVWPDPACLCRVRGCFNVSAEPPALVSGLWLDRGHLGRYLVLRCQKSQELQVFLLVTFSSQVGP